MQTREERCYVAQARIEKTLMNLIQARGYGKEALPFIDHLIREVERWGREKIYLDILDTAWEAWLVLLLKDMQNTFANYCDALKKDVRQKGNISDMEGNLMNLLRSSNYNQNALPYIDLLIREVARWKRDRVYVDVLNASWEAWLDLLLKNIQDLFQNYMEEFKNDVTHDGREKVESLSEMDQLLAQSGDGIDPGFDE